MATEQGMLHGDQEPLDPLEEPLPAEDLPPDPLRYIVEQDMFTGDFHPFSRIVHQDGTEVGILGVTIDKKEDQRLVIFPTLTGVKPRFPQWVHARPDQLQEFLITGEKPVDFWQFSHTDGICRARGIPGGTDLVTFFPNEGDTEDDTILYPEQELIKGILATRRLIVPEQIGTIVNEQIIPAPITDEGLMPLYVTQIGHHVLAFGENTTGQFGASEAEFRKFAQDLHTILFPADLMNQPTDAQSEGWLRQWIRRFDTARSAAQTRMQKIPPTPDFKTASLKEIKKYFAHFAEFEENKPQQEASIVIAMRGDEVVDNETRVSHLYDLPAPFDHVSGNIGIANEELYQFDEHGPIHKGQMRKESGVCPIGKDVVAYIDCDNTIRSRSLTLKNFYDGDGETIYADKSAHMRTINAMISTSGSGEIWMHRRTTSTSSPSETILHRDGKNTKKSHSTYTDLNIHPLAADLVYIGPENKAYTTDAQGIYRYVNGQLEKQSDILNHLQIDSVSPGYGGVCLISGINKLVPKKPRREIVLFNTGSRKEEKKITLPDANIDMIPRMAISGGRVCMLLASGSPASLYGSRLITFSLESLHDEDTNTLQDLFFFDDTYTTIDLSKNELFTRSFPKGATNSVQVRPLSANSKDFLLLAGTGVFKISANK